MRGRTFISTSEVAALLHFFAFSLRFCGLTGARADLSKTDSSMKSCFRVVASSAELREGSLSLSPSESELEVVSGSDVP